MLEMYRKNVLIVETERDVGELFARALEVRRDCKCYLAAGEEEVADLMKDISFDLLLLDLKIAVTGDFRLLKKVKRLFPDTVVIIAAYLHQKELAAKAVSYGANTYLFKPIKVDSFRRAIEQFFPLPATATS